MVRKGEIYYVELDNVTGSEQGGIRPVLIIQNNIGNKYSPTTIVASITSQDKKLNQPTHVLLNENCGLAQTSYVMLEQIRTIDKSRLRQKIGYVDKENMKLINQAISTSFFLTDK